VQHNDDRNTMTFGFREAVFDFLMVSICLHDEPHILALRTFLLTKTRAKIAQAVASGVSECS
jgi:hypothetical protein